MPGKTCELTQHLPKQEQIKKMQCIKEKHLERCIYLVVRIRMTLSESACGLSVKLSEEVYSAVSDTETLFIYILLG